MICLILIGSLSLFSVSPGLLWAQGEIPYGDYSQSCSEYGTCKENLAREDAERAIRFYLTHRGLRLANIQHKGRFVEAEVYRNNRLVDKVLFDRKTGRIRSIY